MGKKSPHFFVRGKIHDIKCQFERCKMHYYIAIGAVMLGFLLAVFRNYSVYDVARNFIYEIRLGIFSPFRVGFLIILFTTLLYLAGFLASIHFAPFCLFGYGGMLLSSFLLWRSAFVAVALSGFYGVIYLIFFVIPVFLLNFLWFSLSLGGVFTCNGFMRGNRKSINFSSQFRIFWQMGRANFIKSLVFNFSLWVVISVTTFIIV